MSQRKNPELDAKHQAILRRMMQLPENKHCADCRGPSPRWASTNLGVFVCIACSGIHRKLGTHISQVRSITLDTWTPAQVAHFQKFGNARAAQYFEACIPPDFRRPNAGDSMQMERFIREKYEKKRFVTTENGGLGGKLPAQGSRRGSSYEMNGSAGHIGPQSGLGRRPIQRGGAYDDASGQGRSTLPTSYGSRFGAGPSPAVGLARFGSKSTGKYNSGRGIGGARPNNAIQRATTLKEIMNMGFPAQLAARAVEAGEGDLQRAVDWVLQNSDSQNEYQTQPTQPTRQPVVHDLLDFGDPEPSSVSEPSRVPVPAMTRAPPHGRSVIDTHSLVAQPAGRPDPPKAADEGFADFADFGAFESALPASTEPKSTSKGSTSLDPSAAVGQGNFTKSIASLYAQAPTAAKSQILQHAAQVANAPSLPQQSDQLHPGTPKRQSPQLSSRPFTNSPGSGENPGSVPSFTWQVGTQSASPVKTSPLTTRLSNAIIQSASKKTPAGVPPPPPPMTELSISDGRGAPPPPNTPPPSAAEQAKPPSRGPETSVDGQSKTTPERTGVTQSESQNGNDQSVPGKKEEPEDPFAALSMMALSSATAKKEPMKKSAVVETPALQKDAGPAPAPKPVNNGPAGINLDDFFG